MGNLKIATWNMQGATSNNDASTFMKAISYMKNYGINVFCIQEAGILSKSSQMKWKQVNDNPNIWEFEVTYRVDQHTYNGYWMEYYLSNDNPNLRCSMAIILKDCDKRFTLLYAKPDDKDYEKCRPIIGINLGGVKIYNVHSPSANTGYTQGYIKHMVSKLGINGENWFLCGDFNCPPCKYADYFRVLFANNGLSKCNGHSKGLCDYSRCECSYTQGSGLCLDYALLYYPYKQDQIIGSANIIDNNFYFSDHLPVLFDIYF